MVRIEEEDCTISSKEEKNQKLRQLLQEKDQVIRQLEEREIQLRQESGRALRQLQEKERQLGHVNQQLEASEQVVAQFERRIDELEQQISQREQQLRWRKGKRAPCGMFRWYDAVVIGNTVYVKTGFSMKIYSYYAITDCWSQLPNCVYENGSITIINGWLTTVGGYSSLTYSNELFSLTLEGGGKRWTKKFPPMPTKRWCTTSLCTGTTLIVAGGVGGDATVLSTVEVMNTENLQWSIATDLPESMYSMSATVCGDQLYMLGGRTQDLNFIKSVYTYSISALLQSCVPISNFIKTSSVDKADAWRKIADLPVTRSTCVSFDGQPLAIGGMIDSDKYSTAVYQYNSTTNSWEIISHMTIGRYDCFSAVLPDNRLVVVGGWTKYGSTCTVELASVQS